MIFQTPAEREAFKKLLEASKEAAEHERYFWDQREQDHEYSEPTWLAFLEDAIKEMESEIVSE